MKWNPTKQYTPQQIQAMQQDAIERVRQMQRRSEQVLRHSPRAPSFFVQEESTSPGTAAPSPAMQQDSTPSPSSRPHSGWSRHTSPAQHPPVQRMQTPANPLETVMGALGLDQDRLLILGLGILLASDGADQGLLLALLYLFL